MDFSCRKFQPNIFNKSRCQNCFKPREQHLSSGEELQQVKAIYAGWLCLAPEGTDFDNPIHRSRKWQRRFFILYEHGRLQFSLDELPSTIPQGVVDLSLGTEVVDAEGRTGQKNALWIITQEQEIFIRGDNKEIINGLSEQLVVFQQVKKQNLRKKKKKSEVSSVQFQEKSLSEKAVCGSGASDMGAVVCRDPCSPEHEDVLSGPAIDLNTAWETDDDDAAADDSLALVKNHSFFQQSCSVDSEEGSRLPPSPSPEPWVTDPDPFSSDSSLPRSASSFGSSISSAQWELDEDLESTAVIQRESLLSVRVVEREPQGYQHCEEHDHEDSSSTNSRIDSGGVSVGKVRHCCRRRRRSRSQTCTVPNYNNKENSAGGLEASQVILHPQRRVRSVGGWASDSTMTPDLLNFKKGHLLTLDDHEQWRKCWSVLSAHSLRFYSESGVEEVSVLVGEIDLTTCHKVTEHSVQRNYGFQLHTHKLVYTLAAVTAGIRQNWIQALLENIQSRNGPDVASLADDQVFLQAKAQHGPDVTQDLRPSHGRRPGLVSETTDWDEIGLIRPTTAQEVNRELEVQHLQLEKQQEEPESQTQNWSRRRGREERRQRYEFVMTSSGRPTEDKTNQDQQQQRMREIEERWLQVERASIRDGKKVLLYPESQSRSSAELGGILEHYQRKESTNRHGIPCKAQNMISPIPVSALTDKYLQTKQLLQLENLRRQHLKTQLSSDHLTVPELNPVCSASDCEMVLNESRLGSHAWHEASWNWEDERSGARVDGFSQGAVMLLREQNVGSGPAVVERFSQEAEFLTKQLEAMNRHNQELLNQLAEANREIDRLKAELLCQPGLESVVESLKVELAGKSQELQVAQNRLVEVEENLKDAQKTLQLREAKLRGLGFLGEDNDDDSLLVLSSSSLSSSSSSSEEIVLARLGKCVQDLEIKVSELECQLSLSEQKCKDFQNHNLEQNVNQNAFLKESMLLNSPKTMITEGDQLETLIDTNNEKIQDVWRSLDGRLEEDVAEERVQMRSNNLQMLLEVIRSLTKDWPNMEQNPLVDSDVLQLERNIWDSLVNALKKDNLVKNIGTERSDSLVQCVQKKLDEIRMDLSALSISISTGSSANNLTSFDNTGLHNGQIEDHSVQTFETVVPVDDHLGNHPIWRGLKHHVEKKLALLNHVALASKLGPSMNSPTNWAVCNQTADSSKHLDPLISAAMDVFMACLVGYHDAQNQERTLKPIAEEFNSSIMGVDLYEGTLLQTNNMAAQEKTGVNEENEMQTMNSLRSHIKELEIQLARSAEMITSLQQQHEENQANLKAAYEQGFTMLKKSHQKLIEDLLLQHQREQQRLLQEKERILAEETAATRIVIEAMNRAHSSEMERLQQKTNWEKSNGYTNITEILQNHNEELASIQRELDALSEQFSQKCLESVHLAQALEAERKALQHCQHKNLALSTCNQELYDHLAKEMIRLSAAERDGRGDLSDSRQQYELEIILRVKESEVEYLKQEISTVKDELKASQMDKTLVTEKYREVKTDLSVVKKMAEEQMGYLREHLRLACEALAESVEERTLLDS